MPDHPYRSYMLCTLPRSGSTMLCKLLAATAVAGNPESHFHRPSLDAWLKAHALGDPAAYSSRREALEAVFAAARKRGTDNNGVFALRMQGGSFSFFREQLAYLYPDVPNDKGRIEAAFGRTLVIHLSRLDRLDQAISLLRAEQTGLWHRWTDGTALEQHAPSGEGGYDRQALLRHIAELNELEKAWDRWFERESLVPIRVSYDELSRDPKTVLTTILSALGPDAPSVATIIPQTAKLADAISLDWRARFEAETSTS